MTHLICKDVSVKLSTGGRRGTQEILKNISFELHEGEGLAVIGPNGAGKSTLLKVLAGILYPSSGTIEVEGDVSALFNIGLGTRKRSSGRRNMILRNLMAGRSYEDIEKLLPEMIEFAGIGEFMDRPMEIYSQGMAMRTVFAASTQFNPEILLLDEWIGAGDMEFRQKSRERMRELASKSGIIVLASHRKALSTDICTKGLYLQKGEIRFLGPIEEAWERYREDGGKRQGQMQPSHAPSDDFDED